MIWRFDVARNGSCRVLTPQQTARIMPPAPHLQINPFDDLARVQRPRGPRAAQLRLDQLRPYVLAHIPIERAMALSVGKSWTRRRDAAFPAALSSATLAAGGIRPWPARSTTIFAVWCVVLFLLVAPVFAFMAYCAVQYRAGRDVDRSPSRGAQPAGRDVVDDRPVPDLAGVLLLGRRRIYLQEQNPPPNAMVITALGRQWMWKFQHPGGQSEINDLHVPVGRRSALTSNRRTSCTPCTSQRCVCRKTRCPAAPRSYGSRPTGSAPIDLFCSELCGADHALMARHAVCDVAGRLSAWLKQAGARQSLAADGKNLFDSYGCSGCHGPSSTVHAPSLDGVYGRLVPLQDGSIVVADDAYIRDRILEPNKQVRCRLQAGHAELRRQDLGRRPGGVGRLHQVPG